MTNRIALGLGLGILVLLTIDLVMYGSQHMVFLGRKLFELIEWMAFWR
jgi:hypothetical protein